jgi:hypothetical protein
MRRIVVRLAIFLLLGAIINVAVAWGCAAWSPLRYGHGDEQSPVDVEWARSVGFSFDESGLPTVIQRAASSGFALCHVYPYSIGGRVGASRYSAGLPFHSFQAHATRSDVDEEWRVACGAALQPDPHVRPELVLPYRPLWPGFAINTIIYAAIVWVLFAVPGAVRRRVRRKRGQCAACGYSRRGISADKCPECGAAVSRQRGAGV